MKRAGVLTWPACIKSISPYSPEERAAYAALDELRAVWQRRNAKLKQSVTKTIQGISLEQLRKQHADRRTD